ncbi:glycosyltransferase involved in cell wall biosynthesis [Maribacter caenipelagi]|uniref:Glycosyltransferase involved in cell wall biosynthesis n=1 Tax=Maribacter caenipelagi TaxID=1447781 RepID=A0A4R7CZR5_9FLAO|nr:glycosyltransferase [Maribacter caenipelagi]TDS13442.1 glycosyltransferase involved in cell wall biosynthesis [Maribacter caenipelagi]
MPEKIIESKHNSPLVSVIVPVYNVKDYLERCINSILNQTYNNLEIILVNDGSTDSSGDICEYFRSQFKIVNLINQVNGGLSVARNAGLKHCSGDFITFVDSDDWLKPNMIEQLLQFAIANNLSMVECGVIKSQDLKKEDNNHTYLSFIESQSEAMFRLLQETNFSVWRRIYKKELLNNLYFIPGKISEDVFFTIDCINKIDKQGCIREPLYVYNTENISITRSPYSLKKIAAKDALFYPVSETKKYNLEIKKRANYLLLRGLIYHYQRILLHGDLDINNSYRKKFKKEVISQFKIANGMNIKHDFVWYKALLVNYTPIIIYKFFLQINELRIKYKQRF